MLILTNLEHDVSRAIQLFCALWPQEMPPFHLSWPATNPWTLRTRKHCSTRWLAWHDIPSFSRTFAIDIFHQCIFSWTDFYYSLLFFHFTEQIIVVLDCPLYVNVKSNIKQCILKNLILEPTGSLQQIQINMASLQFYKNLLAKYVDKSQVKTNKFNKSPVKAVKLFTCMEKKVFDQPVLGIVKPVFWSSQAVIFMWTVAYKQRLSRDASPEGEKDSI